MNSTEVEGVAGAGVVGVVALVDTMPLNIIGVGSIFSTGWLILQMLWAPTINVDATQFKLGVASASPVSDWGALWFKNWLYASYFAGYIAWGTTALPTLIMWIAVLAGWNPTVFMHFEEIWGLWGTIFGCAVPWVFTILYMLGDPLIWIWNFLAIIWNLLVGWFVWFVFMLVMAINVPPMGVWARATIKMIEYCDAQYPDNAEKVAECRATAYKNAEEGKDEFPAKEDEELAEVKAEDDEMVV